MSKRNHLHDQSDDTALSNNAFALLMARKKPRLTRKSRFVLCPVGCHQHIAENLINSHIDQCLLRQEERKSEINKKVPPQISSKVSKTSDDKKPVGISTLCTPKKEPLTSGFDGNHEKKDSRIAIVSEEKPRAERNDAALPQTTRVLEPSNDSPLDSIESSQHQALAHSSDARTENPRIALSSLSASPQKNLPVEECEIPSLNETPNTQAPKKQDAFSTMMSQSKTVFARPTKVKQCFHLRKDGTVHLWNQGYPSIPPKWSAVVSVKDRAVPNGGSLEPTEFEITLSSDLPSDNDKTTIQQQQQPSQRMVQNHSRLSVSVLKSILQKSIRRRRPLPSVKVAMELADKSLGDLLRRLPIIAIEDSSLHPDLDLLVWLMMAYSKDFVLPFRILQRVLEIVYEIAACPWRDDSTSSLAFPDEEESMGLSFLRQSGVPLEESSQLFSKGGSLIWSMLARAEYGGMKGDVKMLRLFSSLWWKRVRDAINDAMCPPNRTVADAQWKDIPIVIHRKAHQQAQERVKDIMARKLDRLRLQDISIEGIDFHCSSILEYLLADQLVCDLGLDLIRLTKSSMTNCIAMEDTKEALRALLKKSIWNFSAGVNWRQSLVDGTTNPTSNQPHEFQSFWNDVLSSRVAIFQRNYVEQRLSAPAARV